MSCIGLRTDELMHTGKSKLDGAKVGSGRYPLGSGERPNQHRGGSAGKWLNQNIKGGKDKPPKSRAEDVANKTGNAVGSLKDAVSAAERLSSSKRKGKDSSGMSDQELRSAINRLNMERQYADLTKGETSRGFQVTMDVLEITKDVAMTAAAIAGVASSIYMLRMKGEKDE